MRKINRGNMIISAILVLSASTAVVSGVQMSRRAPIADRLTGEAASARKNLDSLKEQARMDALLYVKNGGGPEACLTEEGRTIAEASKPVLEKEENAVVARTRSVVMGDLFLLSGVAALLSGAILLARVAFQRRRERREQVARDTVKGGLE